MKKFFCLALAALCGFAACDDGSGETSGGGGGGETTLVIQNQSSRIITAVLWNNVEFADRTTEFCGVWTGRYQHPSPGEIELTIDVTYVGTIDLTSVISSIVYGSWTALFWDDGGATPEFVARRALHLTGGNPRVLLLRERLFDTLTFGSALLQGNTLLLNLTDTFPVASRADQTISLTRAGDFGPGGSISSGVSAGQGHIFFTLGGAAFRTNAVVTVDTGAETTFVFNDATLVVEVANPANARTLGSL